MYKAFFGLSDNPFSIAPNPHYLYLSDRHREALAHLTYGLGETGGFVLLTGEVGTGKTTVSRCLLNQLPDNIDTAFILNPSLTELELLASVCDELAIEYEPTPSLKHLTDLLSRFLLANHQQGRHTVLIIDEAQHLRPEVLEQLRLLTNLETDTKKLLQVILIGQPELQHLLRRQELRQLAQRITARYHLLPLSSQDVGHYVEHRLRVAGRHEPMFNQGAIKALHKFSGGIPRLINLLCERAMMASYGQSRLPIDSKIINMAAVEVLGLETKKSHFLLPIAGMTAMALSAVVAVLMYQQLTFNETSGVVVSPGTSMEQVNTLPASSGQTGMSSTKMVPSRHNLQQSILESAIYDSRNIDTAYASILGLWHKVPYIGLSACQSAKQQGLSCFQQHGNWNSLIQLNYPAVVYLQDAQQQVFYGTVVSRQGLQLLLQLGEQQFWVDRDWFSRHFRGSFEILWQAPINPPTEIGRWAELSQIQWLADSLAKLDDSEQRQLFRFDVLLEDKLKLFQSKHGLTADAIAGSQTLALLNLHLSGEGPRLMSSRGNF